MLLSRFWYVVMAVALGAVLFVLFLSTSMYDRSSVRAMGEALAGDSQVVVLPARRRTQALDLAHRPRSRRRHSHAPREVERLGREDSGRLQREGRRRR